MLIPKVLRWAGPGRGWVCVHFHDRTSYVADVTLTFLGWGGRWGVHVLDRTSYCTLGMLKVFGGGGSGYVLMFLTGCPTLWMLDFISEGMMPSVKTP